MGQVIARLAAGAADAIEAPRLAAYGVLEIGAKGQVFIKVTVDVAPVAGRHNPACGDHHIHGPTAAAPVQALAVFFDSLSGIGRESGRERELEYGVSFGV